MIERRTAAQKSRVRKAYREAFTATDRLRAVNDVYAKFVELYGVSRETLRQIVVEDHKRHEVEYRALQAVRDGQAHPRTASARNRASTRRFAACAPRI